MSFKTSCLSLFWKAPQRRKKCNQLSRTNDKTKANHSIIFFVSKKRTGWPITKTRKDTSCKKKKDRLEQKARLTCSWRDLRSFVTICGWGKQQFVEASESVSSELYWLSWSFRSSWFFFDSPSKEVMLIISEFMFMISWSISCSIWIKRGIFIPTKDPLRATSNRHRIKDFSFFPKTRSSDSKRRQSRIPRDRHQVMKLQTLSRARKVPAAASFR